MANYTFYTTDSNERLPGNTPEAHIARARVVSEAINALGVDMLVGTHLQAKEATVSTAVATVNIEQDGQIINHSVGLAPDLVTNMSATTEFKPEVLEPAGLQADLDPQAAARAAVADVFGGKG